MTKVVRWTEDPRRSNRIQWRPNDIGLHLDIALERNWIGGLREAPLHHKWFLQLLRWNPHTYMRNIRRCGLMRIGKYRRMAIGQSREFQKQKRKLNLDLGGSRQGKKIQKYMDRLEIHGYLYEKGLGTLFCLDISKFCREDAFLCNRLQNILCCCWYVYFPPPVEGDISLPQQKEQALKIFSDLQKNSNFSALRRDR